MAQKSQDRKQHRRSGINGLAASAHEASRRTGGESSPGAHEPRRGSPAARHDGDPLHDVQAALAVPAARFGEISLRAFEQMARFGYQLAGDVLDLTLEQLRVALTTRDLDGWMNRQGELAAGFIGRQARRANDWVRQSADTQEDFTDWATDVAEPASERTRRRTEHLNA